MAACSEDIWCVHAVDNSDGCMQWIIVMAACSEDIWCVHAVDNSDGCMQWILVVAACSEDIWCVHAVDNSDGCMQWILVVCARPRGGYNWCVHVGVVLLCFLHELPDSKTIFIATVRVRADIIWWLLLH